MWSKIAFVLFGWLLGLLSKELTELISLWIRGPKLSVSFDDSEDCVTLTPEEYTVDTGPTTVAARPGKRTVFFARVRITNHKPRIARQVKVWLTNVERKQEGNFKPTIFRDSIPLIWSYDAESEYADVPKNVIRYADLVRIQSDSSEFEPQMRSRSGGILRPLRLEHLFNEAGTLRFTVVVSAENIAPQETKVVVTWDGNWPPRAHSET